jgi:predicted ATPase
MLPVLAAACVRDGLVMIQQPELHIHPALQSAFANVFTDNYENPYFSNDEDRKNNNFSNIQFLIETHSEHLILRFLKLIKDSKKRTDSYRKLKSDDVSIFYFEPNPIKNSTLIKKIRITDDGGFLDRWPNGFFTERFKDIFDE